MSKTKQWIPEIVYEEGESQIPIIHVPPEEVDPKLLFIFLSHQTNEFEPGPDGEELPVMQWDLHQYADMEILKKNLSTKAYDDVRNALGLETLKNATTKGSKITENIMQKLS